MPKPPVQTAVVATEEKEVVAEANSVTYRAIKITYTVASVTLALVLVLVLFAESYVRADALTSESGLEFSTTEFSALVSHFLQ